VLQPVDDKKWEEIISRLMKLEKMFSLGFSRENGSLRAMINERSTAVTPEDFRWMIPKGELEGYH
jgi:hypothetical protein